jgi:hypothetical protein
MRRAIVITLLSLLPSTIQPAAYKTVTLVLTGVIQLIPQDDGTILVTFPRLEKLKGEYGHHQQHFAYVKFPGDITRTYRRLEIECDQDGQERRTFAYLGPTSTEKLSIATEPIETKFEAGRGLADVVSIPSKGYNEGYDPGNPGKNNYAASLILSKGVLSASVGPSPAYWRLCSLGGENCLPPYGAAAVCVARSIELTMTFPAKTNEFVLSSSSSALDMVVDLRKTQSVEIELGNVLREDIECPHAKHRELVDTHFGLQYVTFLPEDEIERVPFRATGPIDKRCDPIVSRTGSNCPPIFLGQSAADWLPRREKRT